MRKTLYYRGASIQIAMTFSFLQMVKATKYPILVRDAVQSGRPLATLRRKLFFPSSGQKNMLNVGKVVRTYGRRIGTEAFSKPVGVIKTIYGLLTLRRSFYKGTVN